MRLRSEILAFAFGVLVILVTFGDDNLGRIAGVSVGNLDTIFGAGLWPVMDVVYPLATITVFLLFGMMKGGRLRIDWATMLLFSSFLLVLALIIVDDVIIGLNLMGFVLSKSLPGAYWVAISWIYPVYSAVAFFLFGRLHERDLSLAR